MTWTFPNGKRKALTFSYDDGVLQDHRLVNIFNKYNMKATFNINSGYIGQQDSIIRDGKSIDHSHIPAEEIAQLYQNHEIAIHTLTHPDLIALTRQQIIFEVEEDRKNLERIAGYPVRGLAYPGGNYNDEVKRVLESLNIAYARTIEAHMTFALPHDFLEWSPTCHHRVSELLNLANDFLAAGEQSLFYIWGHSFDFDVADNWQTIETLCEKLSGKADIWYATNIEICDFIKQKEIIGRLSYK